VSFMWTVNFWKQTAERCIKAAAAGASAFFVVGQTYLPGLDWMQVASAAGVAGAASILMSLASAPFGPYGSPSIVKVNE
jgi:hypothetical protein